MNRNTKIIRIFSKQLKTILRTIKAKKIYYSKKLLKCTGDVKKKRNVRRDNWKIKKNKKKTKKKRQIFHVNLQLRKWMFTINPK